MEMAYTVEGRRRQKFFAKHKPGAAHVAMSVPGLDAEDLAVLGEEWARHRGH